MLARAAKWVGLEKHVSAHWLRHFLATQALANGTDLLQVQKDLLGHPKLATTQRYLHAAQEDFRRCRGRPSTVTYSRSEGGHASGAAEHPRTREFDKE